MGVSREAQSARGKDVLKMTAAGQRERKKGCLGSQRSHQCGYSSTATLLTPVLIFDTQCLPAQLLKPLTHSLSTLARS